MDDSRAAGPVRCASTPISAPQQPPPIASVGHSPAGTTLPIWDAHASRQQYLASQPKVNVWTARAIVAGPAVHSEDVPSNTVQPLGGLRNLSATMSRLWYEAALGSRMSLAFEAMFDRCPAMVEEVLAHVGRLNCTKLDSHLVKAAEECMRSVLEAELPNFVSDPGTESVPVNVPLLDLWRTAAKDPDGEPVTWLKYGAPAGLLVHVEDRGIFPTYDPTLDAAEYQPNDLRTEEDFENYPGVDGDPDIFKEVRRILEADYLDQYDDIAAAERALGGTVVLSKIGAIKKWRNFVYKLRMVIDSKQSGVSKATPKRERTQLPRASDVVKDVMGLLAPFAKRSSTEELIEFLIADFRDAFFILPNHPSERRFFAISFDNKILVFKKTTQGSRGAPLTWARLAALVTRLTQSVTRVANSRISTYVDDPIVVAVGSTTQRRRIFATTLLIWSALGLPLALEKAQIGRKVTWTSAVFQPTSHGLEVSVKENIIAETVELCEKFLKSNYVTHKDLRSQIGKAMHIAGLVPTVRPFLNELYAALHDKSRTGPSPQSIWAKQIKHSVTWLLALLYRNKGQLVRSYDLDVYFGRGPTVDMCLDASPYGLGGYLTENGQITSWFSCGISAAEAELLHIDVGSHTCQQVVEALVVLVALRAWSPRWTGQRARIRVRSDSISALVLCLRLKTTGTGTSIIAREVAVDIADSLYAPHIAEHVPGLENVIADELSRRLVPDKTPPFALPDCLRTVPEMTLSERGLEYYVTRRLPSE